MPDNHPPLNEADIELVVARYQEDLRWLRRVPEGIRIVIYNKGEAETLPDFLGTRSGVRIVPLPNVGREAHSYLTHLTTCYESLATVTVFAQGHPFDHAPDFHERLRALSNGTESPDPFLWYGFLDETDDPHGRRLFVPWSKNPERDELFTGQIFEQLFDQPTPSLFCFRGGAQFSVCRDAARKRSQDFYQKALRLSVEIPHAAHSLERFWDRVFGKPVIHMTDLEPDGVRYGKRIRRLERLK